MKNEVKWPERISYGLSDAADNLVFQVFTTYLLFFYTDIYGLHPGDVAILFLVARILDVIESPLVGWMIDHTNSKYGKSRPFFLWYAMPYSAFALLTFIIPSHNYTIKLLWAYFTYLVLGFLYTTVNLPITSILPTMSNNPREITFLGVIRQFNGSLVQIFVGVFTLPLVAIFGGHSQAKGFFWTMLLFAIISFGLIINAFINIKERHVVASLSHRPFRVVLQFAKRNKPWIILSIIIFVYWLVTAVKNQTTVYYFKYVVKNQSLVPWSNIFMISSLLGILLIINSTAKLGNKKTLSSGMAIALIGQLIIIAGVYTTMISILFIGILINSVGQGIMVGLFSIMLSDTIHYGISLGAQAEGFLASSNDFGVNLGLGIGGLLTAGLFNLSGYVPNQTQNVSTINMININYVWIPILLYLVLLILVHFYPEKSMYQQIASKK